MGEDSIFAKNEYKPKERVITMNKHQLAAKKAWETMRARGYVTKKQKKIKYNNIQKQEQRNILIELLKSKIELFKRTNPLRNTNNLPFIVYLDSPELYFTKTLQKEVMSGKWFDSFNCVIPNNKEFGKFHRGSSFGQNIYGQIEVQYKGKMRGVYDPIPNTTVVNRSFKEYISHERDPYATTDVFNTIFIWADYCGSFSSYLEDIELVFKKKVLGNNSIFAMTFNRRDAWRNKKVPRYSNTNCIVAVNDFVSKIAKKYGYKVDLNEKSGFYKNSMFTAIFEVTHSYMKSNQEKIDKMFSVYHSLTSELQQEFNEKKARVDKELEKINQEVINKGIIS